MEKLKEKLRYFMIGRYGMDQLGQFLAYMFFVVLVLNLFARIRLLELLALAGLFFLYFRMFSKNVSKRYQENQAFLDLRFRFTEHFRKWKFQMGERKTHHIYRCPNCKQKIRIPKGHGKVSIHCPKCGADFIRKS